LLSHLGLSSFQTLQQCRKLRERAKAILQEPYAKKLNNLEFSVNLLDVQQFLPDILSIKSNLSNPKTFKNTGNIVEKLNSLSFSLLKEKKRYLEKMSSIKLSSEKPTTANKEEVFSINLSVFSPFVDEILFLPKQLSDFLILSINNRPDKILRIKQGDNFFAIKLLGKAVTYTYKDKILEASEHIVLEREMIFNNPLNLDFILDKTQDASFLYCDVPFFLTNGKPVLREQRWCKARFIEPGLSFDILDKKLVEDFLLLKIKAKNTSSYYVESFTLPYVFTGSLISSDKDIEINNINQVVVRFSLAAGEETTVLIKTNFSDFKEKTFQDLLLLSQTSFDEVSDAARTILQSLEKNSFNNSLEQDLVFSKQVRDLLSLNQELLYIKQKAQDMLSSLNLLPEEEQRFLELIGTNPRLAYERLSSYAFSPLQPSLDEEKISYLREAFTILENTPALKILENPTEKDLNLLDTLLEEEINKQKKKLVKTLSFLLSKDQDKEVAKHRESMNEILSLLDTNPLKALEMAKDLPLRSMEARLQEEKTNNHPKRVPTGFFSMSDILNFLYLVPIILVFYALKTYRKRKPTKEERLRQLLQI